jgi:hypothetical protein
MLWAIHRRSGSRIFARCWTRKDLRLAERDRDRLSSGALELGQGGCRGAVGRYWGEIGRRRDEWLQDLGQIGTPGEIGEQMPAVLRLSARQQHKDQLSELIALTSRH